MASLNAYCADKEWTVGMIELSPMSYVSNHFVMLPSQCLVGKPLSRCRAFVVSLSHCLLAKPFLVHLPRSLPGPSASCFRSPCSVAKPFFLEPNPCLVAKPLFPAAESLVDVLLLLSPSPFCRALLTLACQVLPAEPLFCCQAFIVSPSPGGGLVATRREQHRGGQAF